MTRHGARAAILAAAFGLALAAGAANAQAQSGFEAATEAYRQINLGDFEGAADAARRAAEAEPKNRAYRLLLISSLQRLNPGEAEKASAVFELDFGLDALISAQRGYFAISEDRRADALSHFTRAVGVAGLDKDQARTARLTGADLALEFQNPSRAVEFLIPLAGEQTFEVQSRLAFALWAADRKADAAEAFKAAADLSPDSEQKAVMARARLFALMSLERLQEARVEFRAADEADALMGETTGASETAIMAASLHEDARAQELFTEAQERGDAPPTMWLDAGYSAQRLRDKDLATTHFNKVIDAAQAGAPEISPETVFQVRRANADMSRDWGAFASVFYGASNTVSSTVANQSGVTQVGGELYYRPDVPLGGAVLTTFARAFITADGPSTVDTGPKTTQGWVGLQLKPFAAQNLVLEASRMVGVGDLARNDWMVRTAWSTASGLDPRLNPGSRMMWSAYVEGARMVDLRQNLGFADIRFGRTFDIAQEGRLLVAPFVGAVFSYDNMANPESAIGAGPGFVARTFFRNTTYEAAKSYVEFTLQYRARVDGHQRAKGLFASTSLAF
jgi:tetratricopeptide (TPR) repeat protein